MAATEARKMFAKARLVAGRHWPYCMMALQAMEPVETTEVPFMAVDKYWRCYYNPVCFAKFDLQQCAAIILHELSHCIRNHAKRCETFHAHHFVWNVAADCEINDDLKAENLKIPDESMFPDRFGMPNGQTVEFYYDHLIKNNVVFTGDECGSGSCSDGAKRPWEQGAPDSSDGAGEGKDGEGNAPGLQQHEADLLRKETAKQIREASKTRGNIPAGWKRFAEQILEPKVDWRREFPALVRRAVETIAGNQDFTFRRPSRRNSAAPTLLFPSMQSPQINATIVIDTSGSMCETQLRDCLGEVDGILRHVSRQAGVRVLCADASVHFAKKVFRANEIELLGGGGTDMAMAITQAAKEKPAPNIIVCLTDGYTGWPEDVGIPVIAGIVGGGKENIPDWIKTVIIE